MFILYATEGALPATWGGKNHCRALWLIGEVQVHETVFWPAQ